MQKNLHNVGLKLLFWGNEADATSKLCLWDSFDNLGSVY